MLTGYCLDADILQIMPAAFQLSWGPNFMWPPYIYLLHLYGIPEYLVSLTLRAVIGRAITLISLKVVC